MKKLVKLLTGLFLFCSLIGEANELNFIQYKTTDGLSFNNVDFLAEDDEGLIYAPTNLGLNVFDGSNFTVYNQYNTEGFCNKVSSVLAFEKGYLLIGTVENGLFLFDKYKEQIIPLPCKEKYRISWVTDIQMDDEHTIWIGSDDGKLYCINRVDLIESYKKGEAINLIQIDGLPALRINTLMPLGKGVLLGNNGPLMYRIRKSASEFIIDSPLSLASVKWVYKISVHNSMMFLGTDRGLFKLDNIKMLSYNETISLGNTWQLDGLIIRSISFHQQNLWVGTEGQGMFRIPVNASTSSDIENYAYSISKRHGINSNYILSSLVDSNENLWIGTWFGGLNKLDLKEQNYTFIYDLKNENDIFSNIIWSVAQGSNQNYWLGTHGNGLCQYRIGENNFSQVCELPEVKSVSSLFLNPQNKLLYVGTWGKGIRVYDERNMVRQARLEEAFSSLNTDRIYSIIADPKQNLWIGSFNNGLQYYNQSTQKLTKIDLKVEGADVRFLLLDENRKVIWLASLQRGVYKLDFSDQWNLENTTRYSNFNGEDETIKPESFFLDRENRLWILTRDGFGYFDEQIQDPRKIEPLKGNIVTGMTEDKNGFLWLSTYKGIHRINRETFETESMLNDYSFHSVSCDKKHDFIIASSDEGLVRITPNEQLQDRNFPKIRLSGLKIFDQEIKPETELRGQIILPRHINYCDTLVIPHFGHTFSLRLNALLFSGVQKEKIQYKLEAFEAIWNEQPGTTATAVYTNVPPGEYRLKVKVTNEQNEWSPERVLVIIKLKPWWGTNFALFVYFLLMGGIVFLVIREINIRVKIRQELKIERIKQEREHELYQQKAVFFTNISHDLRTPLTLIVGPLEEMLESKQHSEKVEQTLQRMLKNARMLLNLINQILDFRKAETNNLKLDLKKINLNDFLRNIYFQFNELAQNKKIDLELLCPDESVVLIADPHKLESVLFNLLSNSIKFTPSYGSILIEYKEEPDFVNIMVSDTGIGMDEKELPNIFNRFYQLKPSGNSLGTGIGLNLVKRYVDLHRGKIDIQSSPGKGTHFYIHFPKYADVTPFDEFNSLPMSMSSDLMKIESQNTVQEKKGQVLVVIDDHQDILDYLTDILSPTYHVFTALDGKSGLSLVARKNPDLVISDVMMDDMDGLAVCKQIKSNLNSSHIPVILLTAKNAVEDRIDGFDSGADEYIEKPFNSKLLLTRVRTLIEHRQLLKKRFLLSDLQNSEPAPSSVDDRFMKRIMEIIDKNMADSDFSVPGLVDEMKMSQDQLYRKVKALTGLSINHFIRLLRLKKAAQLLTEKNYTVSEVVFQTGFNNPSYFTKCFKAEYGVLPSDYVLKKHSENS